MNVHQKVPSFHLCAGLVGHTADVRSLVASPFFLYSGGRDSAVKAWALDKVSSSIFVDNITPVHSYIEEISCMVANIADIHVGCNGDALNRSTQISCNPSMYLMITVVSICEICVTNLRLLKLVIRFHFSYTWPMLLGRSP